jgi:hypothetical protein
MMEKDQTKQQGNDEPGWDPSVLGVDEPATKDQRSLDIGGSGQFAPGGYYNQQDVSKPDRIDLDEELAPRSQAQKRG